MQVLQKYTLVTVSVLLAFILANMLVPGFGLFIFMPTEADSAAMSYYDNRAALALGFFGALAAFITSKILHASRLHAFVIVLCLGLAISQIEALRHNAAVSLPELDISIAYLFGVLATVGLFFAFERYWHRRT